MFSLNSNSDIEIYLQDLILQSISSTADEQARLEIKQITETLVKLTNQINQSDIEVIVSDLVHNFLFPTVQRILTQRKSH
jgi:phenylpyruvate tautomerase PptA (4-oxalocrotonate tautomerase family)